jgi:hypothetical protein
MLQVESIGPGKTNISLLFCTPLFAAEGGALICSLVRFIVDPGTFPLMAPSAGGRTFLAEAVAEGARLPGVRVSIVDF